MLSNRKPDPADIEAKLKEYGFVEFFESVKTMHPHELDRFGLGRPFVDLPDMHLSRKAALIKELEDWVNLTPVHIARTEMYKTRIARNIVVERLIWSAPIDSQIIISLGEAGFATARVRQILPEDGTLIVDAIHEGKTYIAHEITVLDIHTLPAYTPSPRLNRKSGIASHQADFNELNKRPSVSILKTHPMDLADLRFFYGQFINRMRATAPLMQKKYPTGSRIKIWGGLITRKAVITSDVGEKFEIPVGEQQIDATVLMTDGLGRLTVDYIYQGASQTKTIEFEEVVGCDSISPHELAHTITLETVKTFYRKKRWEMNKRQETSQ